jgi:hypothetical protein
MRGAYNLTPVSKAAGSLGAGVYAARIQKSAGSGLMLRAALKFSGRVVNRKSCLRRTQGETSFRSSGEPVGGVYARRIHAGSKISFLHPAYGWM